MKNNLFTIEEVGNSKQTWDRTEGDPPTYESAINRTEEGLTIDQWMRDGPEDKSWNKTPSSLTLMTSAQMRNMNED